MHDWIIYAGIFICALIFLLVMMALVVLTRLFKKLSDSNLVVGERRDVLDAFLTMHFPYYNHLSEKGKQKFIERTDWFTSHKSFYGKEELEVTNEMVWHVCACFTQLTFGLRNYRINNYTKIFLYPDVFYSRLLDANVKGLTFKRTAIHLSWKNFKEGYDNPHDKLNLGLHELAHALKFNLLGDYDFDLDFADYVNHWKNISESEYKELSNDEPSFLRAYGGANREEFFAVCVEHFFEAPHLFQKELPDVYNHLCVLLNQNPINIKEDYVLNEAFKKSVNETTGLIPVPVNSFRNRLIPDFYGSSLQCIVVGLLIGFPVAIYYSESMFTNDGFFISVAVPVFVAGLLQLKLFKIHGYSDTCYFLVYNFLGVVLGAYAMFAFSNERLTTSPIIIKQYIVKSMEFKRVDGRISNEYYVNLKANELQEKTSTRAMDDKKVFSISQKQLENEQVLFELHLQDGFWGVPVVRYKAVKVTRQNNVGG